MSAIRRGPLVHEVQQEATQAFGTFGTPWPHNTYDVQPGALYDSIFLSPGQVFYPCLQLFCNPAGKTTAQTNVHQAKRLDAPEQFFIKRVVFTFGQSAKEEDIYAIAENAPWSLWLGQKMQVGGVIVALQTIKNVLAPIRTCDFCQSVYCNDSTCPGCGARQFSLSALGSEEAGKQFFLEIPAGILILSQTSFFVQFDPHPEITLLSAACGGRGLKLWCHLEGLHARGVQ